MGKSKEPPIKLIMVFGIYDQQYHHGRTFMKTGF